MTTTRTLKAHALQALESCDRVALQYIYSPGDRHGTRYVVTVDGWQDRVWRGSRAAMDACAALNAGQDI